MDRGREKQPGYHESFVVNAERNRIRGFRAIGQYTVQHGIVGRFKGKHDKT